MCAGKKLHKKIWILKFSLRNKLFYNSNWVIQNLVTFRSFWEKQLNSKTDTGFVINASNHSTKCGKVKAVEMIDASSSHEVIVLNTCSDYRKTKEISRMKIQ